MLDKLQADIKTAMLARDTERVGVLRFLKSALQSEAINTRQELTEEQAMQVMRREAKKRQEAITLYEQAGDAERAGKEQAELEVINTYLPQPLSSEELSNLVDEVIGELGTDTHQGQVIQTVIKRAEGRADGKQVSELVRERLN